jgi:hypothetical protein
LNREVRERDDDDDIDRQMNRLVELELITGSSAEDIFLQYGFTWSDFYSWARGKIVWISPDIFFVFTEIDTGFQMEYTALIVVRTMLNEEVSVYASSEAHATVVSDFLLQLLTNCESRVLELSATGDSNHFPVSGLAFLHFLAQSRNL